MLKINEQGNPMTPSHLFQLSKLKPQNQKAGGYRIEATKANFPLLQGMSLYKLVLNLNGVREPHWHANADELGFCLKGRVLVTFYANGNNRQTFLVKAGEAFFVPSGTLHGIENVGNDTSELIIQFSHEQPEDFGLSSTFGMFSDAVLGNTWGLASSHFAALKRSTEPTLISLLTEKSEIPKEAQYVSPYRYNLLQSSPLIDVEGGVARVARQDVWPVLKHQALYDLQLNGKGMREPHWHPETAELGYVRKGKGRMSILSPNGSIDTYEMNEGDIYFIPKAYPHHIENLTEELHLHIFFDNPMPGDIGLTGSVKAFGDNVLSASLNGTKELFAKFPVYHSDLFIVTRVNQIDPIKENSSW